MCFYWKTVTEFKLQHKFFALMSGSVLERKNSTGTVWFVYAFLHLCIHLFVQGASAQLAADECPQQKHPRLCSAASQGLSQGWRGGHSCVSFAMVPGHERSFILPQFPQQPRVWWRVGWWRLTEPYPFLWGLSEKERWFVSALQDCLLPSRVPKHWAGAVATVL